MVMCLIEGFDKYSNSAGLAVAGYANTGTVTINTTGGMFGAGALMCQNNGGTCTIPFTAIDASTTGIFHCAMWLKVSDLPAADSDIANFFASADGVASGLRLRVNSAGDFLMRKYASPFAAIGTVAAAFADLAYHHLEIEGTFKNSGGHIKVWIDGVLQINYSGDTYDAETPASINRFILQPPSSCTVYVDDLTVWDETGANFAHTGPLGEHRIETRGPASESACQFTPSTGSDNNLLVDETNGHNGDTDYVESSTVGHVDLYDLVDLGSTPLQVHCIAVKAIAKKTDTGSVNVSMHLKSGGVDSEGSAVALTGAYSQISFYNGLDPATSTTWVPSDLDAALFGFEYQS